jgi:hypothetical protein
MMISKQNIIEYVTDLCKEAMGSELEVAQIDSELTVLSAKRDDVIKSLMMSFRLSDIGVSIQSIGAFLTHAKLESFIKPIAKQNDLPYNKLITRTMTYSASDPKLYRKLTLEEVSGFEAYRKLLQEFVLKEIIPFFESRSTIEGLGDYVLQHPFDNIINIGLGGEYPVNVLKAITIAKWCGSEAKYEEYIKGLQTWIDEDRNDPNYAKMCDAYQGALDELKSKLGAAL